MKVRRADRATQEIKKGSPMKTPAILSLAGAVLLASVSVASAGLLITGGTGSTSAVSEASSPFPINLVGYSGGALYAQDAGTYSFTYTGLGDPA